MFVPLLLQAATVQRSLICLSYYKIHLTDHDLMLRKEEKCYENNEKI